MLSNTFFDEGHIVYHLFFQMALKSECCDYVEDWKDHDGQYNAQEG